jgi:hypothetical protein
MVSLVSTVLVLMDSHWRPTEDHTLQWMMLIHQVILDMHQELNYLTLMMPQVLTLAKEITRLRKIKLKLNQFSQHAMDQTVLQVLIAWNQSQPRRRRAWLNYLMLTMPQVLMPVKEITKLKKIKLKLNQHSQNVMDQMESQVLIASKQRNWSHAQVTLINLLKKVTLQHVQFYHFVSQIQDCLLTNASKVHLSFNLKTTTNISIITNITTSTEKMTTQLILTTETIKVRTVLLKLNQHSQYAMDQMVLLVSTAWNQSQLRRRA